MIKKLFLILPFVAIVFSSSAQQIQNRQHWVDSVFSSLSEDQRLAQLMVVRLSARQGTGVAWYDKEVSDLVRTYNIGSICLFQGNPAKQASVINSLQSIAKTPLMVCVDAEYGVGMRFDSVANFPFQLTMGALNDAGIVNQVGIAMGQQCKRIGIHVNYAPVVDINNNPDNPVINFRSFGEDKYKVGLFGVQIMKGMQDQGVMACAKHFPGHGDVAVDSHFDLPVINKNMVALDTLELYPFKEMFKAGVGSVMIAHLYIPSIDPSANRATSLSYQNVTKLLKDKLGYQGLTFTDALEMQGVKKFFPNGDASVESLIAGNDMLCLPGDVPASIAKIKAAIKSKRLSWEDIDIKVKKVLQAKYDYVLPNAGMINPVNLTADLNASIPALRKKVAENAITMLRNDDPLVFPLPVSQNNKLAYVGIGIAEDNAISKRMKSEYNADIYYFDYKSDPSRIPSMLAQLKSRYDAVVVGVHNYARYPANNFGISPAALSLLNSIQKETHSISFFFGNPYAIKNACDGKNIVACYEDDEIFQNAAVDVLQGMRKALGRLPVTVCNELKFGAGIVGDYSLPAATTDLGIKLQESHTIDSIANDAIAKHATPGCVVLVAKEGKVVFKKAYGYSAYDSTEAVTTSSLYDMASCTKIFATTVSVMKLHDEGKLNISKTLGDYLPWVRGSNKEHLVLKEILLHQAGLKSFIPFYAETIDKTKGGLPLYTIYSEKPVHSHNIRVAEKMFMRDDWVDTIYSRILKSELGPAGKYVYSDNDFIFLGKIVEAITGRTLDNYAKDEFYDKLKMTSTGFKPRERFVLSEIEPTEEEVFFRSQLLRGDVHDPGAAMFGGVAGHAGLFSNVGDLAIMAQMLLDGGKYGGQSYIKKETIDTFSAYQSDISRRGFGFDKPEKDNATRKAPYPCLSASPLTFGHTGFTGTCIWVDPKYNLVYIFLSNRVNPYGGANNKLLTMNVRTNIQEAIYQAMGVQAAATVTTGL